MTKRAFRVILERQRSSGLTIREFCLNESYNPASFHHWKSKFGFISSKEGSVNESDTCTEALAPVRFPTDATLTGVSAEEKPKEMDGIMIELPAGVKIHFRGSIGTKAAMGIISQMYSSHVLPE